MAEDDADVAATLLDFLSGEGFSVFLAEHGEAALDIANATQFDVLLTDLQMPRLDGMTLIQRLRDADPQIPVVIMTGYAPAGLLLALRRSSGGAPLMLIEKPMSLLALRQALLATLGESPHSVA